MAYNLPNFNIPGDVWFAGNAPILGPPDNTGNFYQLYTYSRADPGISDFAPDLFRPTILVRVPVALYPHLGPPLVGCIFGFTDSQGFVWYYSVKWWNMVHQGFPNEYVECQVAQCDSAGVSPDSGR